MSFLPADPSPTLPDFEALSPDLQYKLVRRWQCRDWAITTLASVTSAAMLTVMAVPPLNAIAEAAFYTVLYGGVLHSNHAGHESRSIIGDFASPIMEGEHIASYRVTSGYGLRDTSTLPSGASADHKGVDLATPVGIKLYAPGNADTKVKVQCWRDRDGGGLVADIETPDAPTLVFQALHLESCITGMIQGGRSFATTGDSGIGSAHLDWRQRNSHNKEHQHPQQQYLLWALTGTQPAATLSDIDVLRNAIIGQESAWESRIVNEDSGALGLGQVMPENLAPLDKDGREIPQAGWDYEALGEDLTSEAFLHSPDKQIKVINHQLASVNQQQIQDGFNKDQAIKRTAAVWYSGDADKVDDPTSQPWHGTDGSVTDYPSVKEHADAAPQPQKQ